MRGIGIFDKLVRRKMPVEKMSRYIKDLGAKNSPEIERMKSSWKTADLTDTETMHRLLP